MEQELNRLRWRKSSYSGGGGGNGGGGCVEIAGLGSRRAVRDSKDPEGPAITFDGTSWNAFVNAVKKGHLA